MFNQKKKHKNLCVTLQQQVVYCLPCYASNNLDIEKRNVLNRKKIIRQDRLILSIFVYYMPNDDGFVWCMNNE